MARARRNKISGTFQARGGPSGRFTLTMKQAAKRKAAKKKAAKKKGDKSKTPKRQPKKTQKKGGKAEPKVGQRRLGRLPVDVKAAVRKQLPKSLQNANILDITRRGNGYRVIVQGKDRQFKVFTWIKTTAGYKLFPASKLEITKITKAKPNVRGRTVRTTIGP